MQNHNSEAFTVIETCPHCTLFQFLWLKGKVVHAVLLHILERVLNFCVGGVAPFIPPPSPLYSIAAFVSPALFKSFPSFMNRLMWLLSVAWRRSQTSLLTWGSLKSYCKILIQVSLWRLGIAKRTRKDICVCNLMVSRIFFRIGEIPLIDG